ncbi:MAG TPA: YhgE/Pip domain-containing protein [Nocardioidaceae bacterium]
MNRPLLNRPPLNRLLNRLLVNRVLVAAVLLPMLFGSLVLWSMSGRVDRIDAVPAAVVNLDEPVRTGTGGDRQTIFAGRLLAAGLTDPAPQDEHTLDWRLTTPEDASSGLREGDYYAVVTIPKGFSKAVAGLTRNDPGTARITVRSNDSASALVGLVSDQIGDVAAARLNQRITATFLEGMYAQTGRLKMSLGRAASGADRLADGAVLLDEGTTRLSSGAGRLAGGLDQLSGGAGRLAEGAGRLADGADRLSEGTGRLSAGAGQLAGGARQLAGGLDRLHDRTGPLPGQTRQLADGAGKVADGVDGWSQVLLSWKQACESDPVLAGSHAKLCAMTVQAVGADNGNAEAMVSGSRRIAEGADRLADGTPRLVSAIGQAAGGADRLAGGADRLAGGAARLHTGTERLATGTEQLGDGAGKLADGATQASGGALQLADGSSRLASGSSRLSNGSRQLATGLDKGAERIPSIDRQERDDLAGAVSRPVVSTADRLNATPSAATSLAPGVVALALWLGAFVTYLVREALPGPALSSATSPLRVALAGWLPAVLVGVVQTLLLFAVLGLFGVVMESPLGVAVFLLVPAAVFAAVNQALVAALGPKRGWMVSIVFAALQAVSLGGLVPVDTAPELIQSLSGVLPVSLAAEGIGNLTLGGRVGSVAGSLTALVVWGGVALAVTTVAARRRQRLTLSDVRRRVATRLA